MALKLVCTILFLIGSSHCFSSRPPNVLNGAYNTILDLLVNSEKTTTDLIQSINVTSIDASVLVGSLIDDILQTLLIGPHNLIRSATKLLPGRLRNYSYNIENCWDNEISPITVDYLTEDAIDELLNTLIKNVEDLPDLYKNSTFLSATWEETQLLFRIGFNNIFGGVTGAVVLSLPKTVVCVIRKGVEDFAGRYKEIVNFISCVSAKNY